MMGKVVEFGKFEGYNVALLAIPRMHEFLLEGHEVAFAMSEYKGPFMIIPWVRDSLFSMFFEECVKMGWFEQKDKYKVYHLWAKRGAFSA
jgi:hypothetical protein